MRRKKEFYKQKKQKNKHEDQEEKKEKGERESVCVCVCVCVWFSVWLHIGEMGIPYNLPDWDSGPEQIYSALHNFFAINHKYIASTTNRERNSCVTENFNVKGPLRLIKNGTYNGNVVMSSYDCGWKPRLATKATRSYRLSKKKIR